MKSFFSKLSRNVFKTKGNIIALFMAIAMIMCTIGPAIASASTGSTNSTKAENGISVTITTDKEEYSAEERIVVKVSVENTGASDVKNVRVNLQIPDGISLADGTQSTVIIGTVAANATVEKTVNAIADKDIVNPPINGGDDSGNNGDATTGDVTTGDVTTGDNYVNVFYLIAVMFGAVAVALCLVFRKKKAAGIIAVVMITTIGAFATIQTSYAKTYGSIEVSKTVKVDGEEKIIKAIVSYGEKVAETEVADNYKRVSVHDPSIVKDPATGTYYIYGSHRAWAKSTDLINWTTFTNNLNNDATIKTMLAKEISWSSKGSSKYDVTGNLWAPDVIWNEVLGKWCMYLSVNGDNWYTSIVLLTADSLEGDWTYAGNVVYSGFTNEEEAAETDFAKVTGTNNVPNRYLESRNGNHTYGMNAIDPAVFYDEDGNLWMSYGSWFGGIYMLKLDGKTGLRDYEYKYETVANTSDEYQGIKIAGGSNSSGEAPYIEKIGNYYFLFVSYGGLVANGGYNMRVFRSENPTGPFVDEAGNDARFASYNNNVNGTTGIKLMSNYKWSYWEYGHVAQGHNSAFVDSDGKAYVVYHTRTTDGTEGHSVRIHQLFVNSDGWLVAAPYEYTGETVSDTGYDKAELTGTYEVLYHKQSINYTNLECVTPQKLQLNNDGTVSGDYTGTWTVNNGSPYVTMVLNGVEYNGLFVEQYMENTRYKTMCFTLLGDNQVEFWGSKYLSGKEAVDLTISSKVVNIPKSALSDIKFVTEGLYGTTVSYASEDTSVISNTGKVTRSAETKTVTVKVTYTNGDYIYSKDYDITVTGNAPTKDGRILIAEYYTDSKLNISNADEGTYRVANPYNSSVSAGLKIYNGVSIEFDVEGTGSYLSNILSFYGSGRLYFTGGSYLGYNATGGFFDANVKNSDPWAAGNDYINGKATIRIDINGQGFTVYSNGNVAYTSENLATGDILGSKSITNYSNVLTWLNKSAESLNFGWGSWWNDKFNGTISNVKLYANKIEESDTSNYVYYNDFSDFSTDGWASLNILSSLQSGYIEGERGTYLNITSGTDSGNRGAYFTFDDKAKLSGKYTISIDTALTAGVLTQRSESGFTIYGSDGKNYNNNAIVSEGYILKLFNKPPEGTKANQSDSSNQTKWTINDSSEVVDIPVGEWVNITAEVDTTVGGANIVIKKCSDNSVLYSGVVTINGTGTLQGIQVLRGRGVGTASIDNIKLSEGINSMVVLPRAKEPTTATSVVNGKAYADKASTVTVTFTADEKLTSNAAVKINDTQVSKNSVVGMMTVESITYNDKVCTVVLKSSALENWHKNIGSYDIELVNGSTTLATQNVSYELDIAEDSEFTKIDTSSTNAYSSAYYKVDGTTLYVMVIIKSDKIHSDSVAAGNITYGWYNCINAELYMTVNSEKYNLGMHMYTKEYINSLAFMNQNTSLIDDNSGSVRSFIALGTFDDDTDTDKGVILLEKLDLTKAGFTADTLSGVTASFSGYIGPNDYSTNGDGSRFSGIDETKIYSLG